VRHVANGDPDFEEQPGLHCQLFLPECRSGIDRNDVQAFLYRDGTAIAGTFGTELSGGVPEATSLIFTRVFWGELKTKPGEYLIKVLFQTHVIRELAFRVSPDGRLAGQGVASDVSAAGDKTIVPVKVLRDIGTPWNHDSYKTQAFWFNPLDGFLVP
jgi:hypothetical protein